LGRNISKYQNSAFRNIRIRHFWNDVAKISEHFGIGEPEIVKRGRRPGNRYFGILHISFSGIWKTGGQALCVVKPRNRTVVIWKAVTWTRGIALGLNEAKAISANQHFGDRKDEGSRTLDIEKQEIPKPKNIIPVVKKGMVGYRAMERRRTCGSKI
jgi:hypothetical protein